MRRPKILIIDTLNKLTFRETKPIKGIHTEMKPFFNE